MRSVEALKSASGGRFPKLQGQGPWLSHDGSPGPGCAECRLAGGQKDGERIALGPFPQVEKPGKGRLKRAWRAGPRCWVAIIPTQEADDRIPEKASKTKEEGAVGRPGAATKAMVSSRHLVRTGQKAMACRARTCGPFFLHV